MRCDDQDTLANEFSDQQDLHKHITNLDDDENTAAILQCLLGDLDPVRLFAAQSNHDASSRRRMSVTGAVGTAQGPTWLRCGVGGNHSRPGVDLMDIDFLQAAFWLDNRRRVHHTDIWYCEKCPDETHHVVSYTMSAAFSQQIARMPILLT
ncbi:hypothetical protein CCHR01_06399 [Colletotrichum chrysophilum]|uniref:Uncharacterized protein n=1 Tax=Colletotrichum chrysophilum TaxID=1836956 RepID=A0AAD9EJS4_9PEZI|nr:hypothetical protein CCHR01_06399 [Colletotrichum chrysophilum]